MDAWCALWFWPLTEDPDAGGVTPPTPEQWYDALRMILGGTTMSAGHAKKGDDTFESLHDWDQLGEAETNDRIYAGAAKIEDVVAKHAWLAACGRVSNQQGFFHWEFDFASVFARGGFDLQLGNPPWVVPSSTEVSLLAEGDPWWQLKGATSQAEEANRRIGTLEIPGIKDILVAGVADVVAASSFTGSTALYPVLSGTQPDLYRSFIAHTWNHVAPNGCIGLVHPGAHFTDERAGHFRATCYTRLRRSWNFQNELKLFDIGNQRTYGAHIYGVEKSHVGYKMASSLYHPDTVVRSLRHDGSGPEPGIKTEDGHWDMAPHSRRVFEVTDTTLRSWAELTELPESEPTRHTKSVFAVNRSSSAVLQAVASTTRKVGDLPVAFAAGWNESDESRGGHLRVSWGPAQTWEDVVLQGAQLFVANPFFQRPNSTMSSHRDWARVDLEGLAPETTPITKYKPNGSRDAYNAAFPTWESGGHKADQRRHFRVFWRSMAAPKGERTLMPAIAPPGAAYVTQSIYALGIPGDSRLLVTVAGTMSSLVSDFIIRAVPKSSVARASVRLLPATVAPPLEMPLILRTLRLNCLTVAYSPLWHEALDGRVLQGGWTGGLHYADRPALDDVDAEWTANGPLRRESDRRQAQLEIDAIVALSLGLTADELCTIYRTQFPVLYGYDRNKYFYDANGRLVPNEVLVAWRRKGEDISEEERTATNASGNTYTYELPFVTLDREADMRQAYAHFEKVLAERDG
jgi:hypothetical protein